MHHESFSSVIAFGGCRFCFCPRRGQCTNFGPGKFVQGPPPSPKSQISVAAGPPSRPRHRIWPVSSTAGELSPQRNPRSRRRSGTGQGQVGRALENPKQNPELDQVKNEVGDNASIIKIDVDRNQQIAQSLQIQGVPTLILYKNGKQLWRQSGVVQKEMLVTLLNQHS